MTRRTRSFVAAPRRSVTWLVRARAGGALCETLVPPGTCPPGPDREPEAYWRIWRYADPAVVRGGDHFEEQLLTVRQALAFTRADREQASWVYERTILYAQHLLTLAAEHIGHDRSRASEARAMLSHPALELLDEVREATGEAGLPPEALRTAIDALPELALMLLRIRREAPADVVAGRAG
jgi:hypothetical protein